jgi:hypothetical protein
MSENKRAWSLIRNEKIQLLSLRDTAMGLRSQRHCMCKEMPVIPVNKVVDQKRIIGKNGGPRRRRGTKGD